MFFGLVKKSLKLKIILVSIIVELIILSILLMNSLQVVDESIEHQANIKKESISPLLDSALSIPLFERDYATLIELLEKLMMSRNSEFTYITVYDDKGNIFSETVKPSSKQNSPRNNKILNITAPLTIANDEIGVVKYGLSIQSLYEAKSTLLEEGMLIAILGVILTVVLLSITSYYLIKPITELLRCSKDISSGNYDVKIPIETSDEIGLLAKEFNTMTAAVKGTISKIKSRNLLLGKISSRVPGMVYQFELRKDGSMSFTYLSDAIEKIYHLTAKEVYDDVTKIFDTTHPDDLTVLYDSIQESAKTLEPWKLEYRICDKDGTIRWLCGNSLPEKTSNGSILWHGFVTDITSNKEMTDTLRRSQKMDALGKLTGGIAHDYNNMLGVILGFAELLKEKTANQPELNNYVDEISNAGERGANLTKKLLDFSRQRSTLITAIDINKLLLSDQDMLKKTLTARINLKTNLDDKLWPVYLDESELEDAILNLCINAMHAIEDNGEIIITTQNTVISENSATHLGLKSGEYVQLSISDTGCGIDESIKEKIFDPFYTTKGDKGTGLGLSQVYGFVSRSNGAIHVESTFGKRTIFNLYFPKLQDNNTSTPPSKIEEDKGIIGSETILVVDDEQALLDLTYAILSKHGYKVLRASSAKIALELLESKYVDLLISDIIMPEMDGYELASIVQEQYPHIKIQLVSGFSSQENLSHKNNTLYENMLPKPYNIKSLVTKVRQLLQNNS